MVPTRITSSAAISSGKVTRVPTKGIPRLDKPEDELPGRPREDLVALGRPFESALPDPEQREWVASVTKPAESSRIGLVAARAAGGLDREDVGQQVRRLDIAALPAQVGLADHLDPCLAEPGRRAVVVGANHDQLGGRDRRVRKGV